MGPIGPAAGPAISRRFLPGPIQPMAATRAELSSAVADPIPIITAGNFSKDSLTFAREGFNTSWSWSDRKTTWILKKSPAASCVPAQVIVSLFMR